MDYKEQPLPEQVEPKRHSGILRRSFLKLGLGAFATALIRSLAVRSAQAEGGDGESISVDSQRSATVSTSDNIGVGQPSSQTPEVKPTPEPQSNFINFAKPEISISSSPKPEVFGIKNKISTFADLTKILGQINERNSQVAKNMAAAKKFNPPKDVDSERKLMADSRIRTLEVIVKRSLYDKFQVEADKGGLDLVSWLRAHIEYMNGFIHGGVKEVGLSVALKRVIVVDDSVRKIHGYYDLIGEPADVDAIWGMWDDYRGDVDPRSGKETKSAYLGQRKVDGKDVIIDFALIHEWNHALLNWPDEYWANCEVEGLPKLDIIGASGIQDRTYWYDFCLQRIAQKNIRGIMTDSRGWGRAGFGKDKDDADSVFGEVPSKVTLSFKDEAGLPIDGFMSAFKAGYKAGPGGRVDYYSEKKFAACQIEPLSKGSVTANLNFFTPAFENNEAILYPLDWMIQIQTREGRSFTLPLPVMGFNMSKLSGLGQANYELKIYDKIYTQPKELQLIMIRNTDFDRFCLGRDVYASMPVVGTPITFVWF